MLVTPLQLAVMTARLANGGKAVTPRLTRRLITADGADILPKQVPAPDLGIHPAHLAAVTGAMADVVNSPRGTAYRSRISEKGFEIGGKTGTVQVRRITRVEREQGVRKNEELEWRHRDHALFVGFGPVDAPRYAAGVVVEHGGGGSSVAAPIAREILLETLRRDPSGGREGDVAAEGARRAGKG
jgi:penicillin-binding protein 2